MNASTVNTAMIFAGGTGTRMNTRAVPKQFLELHGKPIIIYTLEIFEATPEIDAVVVACLESWIVRLKELLVRFGVKKVVDVAPGGETGFDSRRNGVARLHELYGDDAVCLVHDGVRPLVNAETVSRCIASVRERGSGITVAPATETITIKGESNSIGDIVERDLVDFARAPQGFWLGELYDAHERAAAAGLDFIDSACLMRWVGRDLYAVDGPAENIKITTPDDFFMFRAVMDARENQQIYGF